MTNSFVYVAREKFDQLHQLHSDLKPNRRPESGRHRSPICPCWAPIGADDIRQSRGSLNEYSEYICEMVVRWYRIVGNTLMRCVPAGSWAPLVGNVAKLGLAAVSRARLTEWPVTPRRLAATEPEPTRVGPSRARPSWSSGMQVYGVIIR